MNRELEKIVNKQDFVLGEVLEQMGGEALFYDLEEDVLVVKEKKDRPAMVFKDAENIIVRNEVLHPLDRGKAKKFVQSLREGVEPDPIRIRWHHKSRTDFEYYKVVFRLIESEDDKQKKIAIGTALNVTSEIKLAEQVELTYPQLMKDEDVLERTLMRYAFNKQFYMTVVIDGMTGRAKELVEPMDDKGSRFVDIENIDENSIKYFRKYGLGDEIEEIIAKTRLSKVIEKLDKEEQFVFFFCGKNVYGITSYFRCEFSYINRESRLIFYSATDITLDVIHNKELEEMMRVSYERERNAIKAKDAFFANMSHEIRTPLNAIVGMAEIAKMDIKNPKKVLECMDIVLSASQNLGRVVSDVLDASSLQSGGIKLTPSPHSVNAVLEQIKQDFEATSKKKHQKFKMNVDVMHDRVMIDAERAKRVLLNLLSNASKFSPENGKITLTVTELPAEKAPECILKIQVSDNGRGICQEDLKHVFEPFYRDKESANNYVPGTGLGLSVVKNIVDEKGATITIDSEPDKGTTVEIMDTVYYIEEEKQKLVANNQVLKGRKVLLVEDQPINMLVARKMLERFGAKVDTAEHGRYAVEKYRNQEEGTYDIIFMDIQMPIMDGYEATRNIRNSGRTDAKSVKIVSMTANVLPEDVEKSRQAGMNAHIGKPIRSEELQQLIVEILN